MAPAALLEAPIDAPRRYSPGLGAGIRELPCCCGGSVRANLLAPAYGVQLHNTTPRHRAWRERREGSGS